MKKLLSSIAVVATLFATTTGAWAGSTIHIKLLDIGGNIDFSKKLDLGPGGHGDMKMAPVSLKIDKTIVPAGKVTVSVTNMSKDIQHELILSPLASKNATLPMTKDGIKVNEDGANALGEVPELDPGKTGKATFNLKPGFYMLYCNIEGHVDAGMWTKIEVK